MYAYTCMHTYAALYICTICTHTITHMYALCMYIRLQVYMDIHTRAHVHIQLMYLFHKHMYVYIYMYICIMYMPMHAYKTCKIVVLSAYT